MAALFRHNAGLVGCSVPPLKIYKVSKYLVFLKYRGGMLAADYPTSVSDDLASASENEARP
jgi:hypothetical protein